jgi:hypothetical protein
MQVMVGYVWIHLIVVHKNLTNHIIYAIVG